MKKLRHVSLALLFSVAGTTTASALDHGAWTYDTKDSAELVQNIVAYEQAVDKASGKTSSHHLSTVYSYGSDIELYYDKTTGKYTYDFYYDAKLKNGAINGKQRAQLYVTALQSAGYSNVDVMPIVDGQISKNSPLSDFNSLTKPQAEAFADVVAKQLCADDNVAGAQFDIEPLKLSDANSQYYFYMRIADDFSGKNNQYHCVDQKHPSGRHFTVFGSAHMLQSGYGQAIFSQPNAALSVSAYDLSGQKAIAAVDPTLYQNTLTSYLRALVGDANRHHLHFKLAIPASASAQEFQRYVNASGQLKTGYQQLQYINAIFAVVDSLKIRTNPNFLGFDLYAFRNSSPYKGGILYPINISKQDQAEVYNTLINNL